METTFYITKCPFLNKLELCVVYTHRNGNVQNVRFVPSSLEVF